MVLNPLDQFSIISILPYHFANIYLDFTNSSLVLTLAFGIFCKWFFHTSKTMTLVPSASQTFFESLYSFIYNLTQEQLGKYASKFFYLIFSLFVFLVFNNLIGMIPYCFTMTSHLAATFGLALTLFIGITIIGFKIHKLHFFSFLLPKGAPLQLAPLLVILELVSYCFRPISLGVRLFANMMAGHTLVHILGGFTYTMMMAGGYLMIASIIPFLVVFALTGLEIGVAILQAYVFTILTCIYISDAINLH
jgi:F-type H+-transporting ATPase subunit a